MMDEAGLLFLLGAKGLVVEELLLFGGFSDVAVVTVDSSNGSERDEETMNCKIGAVVGSCGFLIDTFFFSGKDAPLTLLLMMLLGAGAEKAVPSSVS